MENRKVAKKSAKLLIFIIILHLTIAHCLSCAQSVDDKLKIEYQNRSLNIVAKNIDIKRVLLELGNATKISIVYRADLQKKVSIEKHGIQVSEALKGLLKGINHIVIYSGFDPNKAKIEEVYVLNRAERRRPTSAREKQLAARIKTYQRQINSLKRRLSKIDANSRQGKRYLRSIQNLEKRIQRTERKIY
ncbi:MAG: hypothetical protein PVG51_02020 [Desulfosarcina sp.]|jgi:hypothetical protein